MSLELKGGRDFELLEYEEVREPLKMLKCGKRVGGDRFGSGMLERGGEILWHSLREPLECCLSEEYIPREWTKGIIVPQQKGGDETERKAYKGAMLGSHIGKLFCQAEGFQQNKA